jgi:hypothetical protein
MSLKNKRKGLEKDTSKKETQINDINIQKSSQLFYFEYVIPILIIV